MLGFALSSVLAQLHPDTPARYRPLPPLREQARLQNEWRDMRLARVPALLQKYGVDAWLISQREYAEDTVWRAIRDATADSPHRRTVHLFHTNTSSLGGAPNPLTWIDNTGAIWPALTSILEQYNPRTIALNVDKDLNYASGLHVGELRALQEHLGVEWKQKIVDVPRMMVVEFLGPRMEGQKEWFGVLMENAWAIIEEAFSARVVKPGVTTTIDVEWFMRDRIQSLNLTTWAHPRVSIVTPSKEPGWEGSSSLIHEGDVLHVDYGVSAPLMALHTDTQHLAYVLRASEGERTPPVGLVEGLRVSNRMQELQLEVMRPGMTGNEVLRKINERMMEEGIEGQVFSHPLGDWGHGPGAVTGFNNLPTHVPVIGDLMILPDTFYSIELFAYHTLLGTNTTLRFMQEEDVWWVPEKGCWEWVHGRQERLHIIDAAPEEKRFDSMLRVQS
ncbi:hypothetical protein K488DRAFT_42016 [Vararia minispora EC-137]|uniref:Uncharacterized protein n=1 Tax=Vararia minispora EC-137 TaxID=1314806 RepID=A0ACB8QWZ8_9AGAM|nr:hypothetical protein K488DRAFT_42016 [Vararia minispora EC-137]